MSADPTNRNVALRLAAVAKDRPDDIAIAAPLDNYEPNVKRRYRKITFQQLDRESSAVAKGLQDMGMKEGHRIALLVRFGPDFINLVFALLKSGVTLVLIDPGMGRRNLIRCIADTKPDGFVAIPPAHVIRMLLRGKFPNAKLNVTVGKRYGFLPRVTYDGLLRTANGDHFCVSKSDDSPAAIIYTTGSTGPPKGVSYTHGTFNNQIDQLVERYKIAPGGKDLSGFPLFGLFNAVMGTTTIIPDMDPTRPADVDPPRLLDAIDQWDINQSFGSPALWTRVGNYCRQNNRTVPTLTRILSAGAPVPPHVLENMRKAIHPDGEIFTPYGATEALPVASIESREVLGETAAACESGRGTCVGTRFSGIDWKIIQITDRPIQDIRDIKELPQGDVGELMVRGAIVTKQYITRSDQNAIHKVADGNTIWHRMGDVGYLDDQQRFWFCGRKSHRVQTESGDLYTEPIEGIINSHRHVYRSALVGIGEPGHQTPVVIVEPWPDSRREITKSTGLFFDELTSIAANHSATAMITKFLLHPDSLPTDIRHNSKIFREKLSPWAARRI